MKTSTINILGFSLIAIALLFSLIKANKSNENEPRQTKCYVITDSQSSVYHICEEDISSVLESRK